MYHVTTLNVAFSVTNSICLAHIKYYPCVFRYVPSWPTASVHVNQCLESSMYHLFKVLSPMLGRCYLWNGDCITTHAPSPFTFSGVYSSFKKVFVSTWSIAPVGMNCKSWWMYIFDVVFQMLFWSLSLKNGKLQDCSSLVLSCTHGQF